MKKTLLVVLVLLCIPCLGVWAQSNSWSDKANRDLTWGTNYADATSFTIETAAQLAQLAYMVNNGSDFSGKTITLANDIDLDGHDWVPIGSRSGSSEFIGSFDGAGHTISGMRIYDINAGSLGLFGYNRYDDTETPKNKICRLKLANSVITGGNSVGAIVGWNAGRIEDCHVLGDVNLCFGENHSVNFGGIAGQNHGEGSDNKYAVIRYCSSQAGIFASGFTGGRACGGIAGYNYEATIDSSLYVGENLAGDYWVGAITGHNETDGSIDCCYYRTYAGSDIKGVGKSESREGTDAGTEEAKIMTFGDDGFSLYDKTIDYDGIMKAYSESRGHVAMVYDDVIYVPSGKEIAITHTYPAENHDYEVVYSDPTVKTDPYRGLIRVTMGNDDLTITFNTRKAFEGEGTADNPYLIQSIEDLKTLSHMSNDFLKYNFENTYFELTTDLEFDGTENNFMPISYLYTEPWDKEFYNHFLRYFAGHFDGGHHSISGLNVKHTGGTEEIGLGLLFGKAEGGSIKNVAIKNSTLIAAVDGSVYTGGVVGLIQNEIVENCHVDSTVSLKPYKANEYFIESGGVVGYTKDVCTIKGCTSAADIQINGKYSHRIGGVVGYLSYGTTMQDCLYYGKTFDLTGVTYPSLFGSLVGDRSSRATLIDNYYNAEASTIKAIGAASDSDPAYDTDGATSAYVVNIADATFLGNTLSELLSVDNDEVKSYEACGTNTALTVYDGILAYNGKYYVKPSTSVQLKNDNGLYRSDVVVETADLASDNTFTMPEASVTVRPTNISRREWGGKGTEADPFTISNVAGLNALAEEVNNSALGTLCFTSQYFKQTADIDYSEVPIFTGFSSNFTPIGYFHSIHDLRIFNGNFDGGGHTISGITLNEPSVRTLGLFGCMFSDVEPGSVKNVKLANSDFTVAADSQIVGGIVAVTFGLNSIEKCSVANDVTFHVTVDNTTEEGALGGIVGMGAGRYVTVSNCFSEAQFTNEVTEGGMTYVRDCYNTGAIIGGNQDLTLTSNYYRKTVGYLGGVGKEDSRYGEDVEGAQVVYTIEIAPVEGGTTTLAEPIPTPAVTYNGTDYYTSGTEFQLVCTPDNPQYGYALSNVDDNDKATLTSDLTITTTISESIFPGRGTEENPYLIWTTAHMDKLAQDIKGSAWEKYICKHFKLMADLEYDYDTENNYVPVGYLGFGNFNARKNYFGGIFDGGGHTISGLRIASSSSYHPLGVFGAVINGTVKNLNVEHCKFEKVGGTVIDCGPIAGWVEESASLIEDCHVGDDVMISIDNYHNTLSTGGVVGRITDGCIKGCTSKAWWQVVDHSLNPDQGITYHEVRFGGIAGYAYQATISDCLYLNETQDMSDVGAQGILTYNQNATVTRCYFTCAPTSDKAYKVRFPDANFNVNEDTEAIYENSRLKTWEQGIFFDGDLYLTKDQKAALTCDDARYTNGDKMADDVEIVPYEEGIQILGTDATIADPHARTTDFTMGTANTCIVASYILDADADNSAKIASLTDAGETNITMRNLNLYADNKWNTICLPFDVELTTDDGKCNVLGNAFCNAIVKELTSSSYADGTLTLNFTDVTDRMEAGKPYLIKFKNFGYRTIHWQSLVFLNPNVSVTDQPKSTASNIAFVGTWAPDTLETDDKSVLYLAPNNTLHYPGADIPIKAFHAYFDLIGITAGDLSGDIKAFVMNFDDDATGMNEVLRVESEESNGAIYDLSGKIVNGKLPKGIYIKGGRKVLIK